jgi:phosphate transport system substrate-binding protein
VKKLIFTFGCLAAALVAAERPRYQPTLSVTGVLRASGNDQMGGLLKTWQAGFQKFHPAVQFADTLKGSAAGMYGLDMRAADFALMGRPIFPYERYGTYERAWVYPVPIEVATGSAEALHKSPAYAILVHRDNPLAKLTLKQLDGIFGAQRGGGWNALTWDEGVARTAQENLRTWGQLGVTGPLADQPIHPYGQANLGAGAVTYFQTRVFGGGAMWNPALREYSDRAQMIADLARDPLGIAYAPIAYRTTGVKAVALAETDTGPFVELSRVTVADRSYPLHRPVYLYYTIDNPKTEITDTRGDPRVKEFQRYILSKEGQEDVVREGSYLPLTPAAIEAQLQKLSSKEDPPEHTVLH